MWKKIRPYLISCAISLSVGALSAFFTRDSMDLYSTIIQPKLSPPAILFPIVWAILYTLMGISAAIIYTKKEERSQDTSTALFTYGLSLIVNFFWSIIFFNSRAFLFSFIWLICLLFLILRSISLYKKISPFAAYLQIPYALWVTFAGYLNFAIFILNPTH